MDCVFLAFAEAVHARYASGVIHGVRGDVDAGRFAVFFAQFAVDALGFVDADFVEGEFG